MKRLSYKNKDRLYQPQKLQLTWNQNLLFMILLPPLPTVQLRKYPTSIQTR